MTKTFQLILSPISLNNRNIYHVIYDNLHKSDATVFAFVDCDKTELDFYCQAFKSFYEEPNIHFIGIESDPNNITEELIDVAIEILNKSDLPLNNYSLKNFYISKRNQKLLSELKNELDSLDASEEDKEKFYQMLIGNKTH